jgi:hypothetical protein
MELLEKSEFTNIWRDKVTITLFQDSAGGFHLIVASERSRKETEQRITNGELVAITSNVHNKETRIIQLPTKAMALNEFNLYRVLEKDPGYGMDEYSNWQKTLEGEK